jgi:hypothetical protein
MGLTSVVHVVFVPVPDGVLVPLYVRAGPARPLPIQLSINQGLNALKAIKDYTQGVSKALDTLSTPRKLAALFQRWGAPKDKE